MVEGPEGQSIEYWRARAEALEHEVGLLRELVWVLAQWLPAGKIAEVVEAARSAAIILPGGEVPSPAPSDVRTELQRLWDTLLPSWPDR